MSIRLHRWKNTAQDREFRNNTNSNWDQLENSHNLIENVSEQAKVDSENAKKQASEANMISKSVQKQLEEVVVNGDSSVEAAQARVDKEGNVHSTLKERIDSEVGKIDLLKRNSINSVNVKMFGAKGDGITDDTRAIQTAIDFVKEKGSIYFPEGKYRVTDTILLYSNSHYFTEGLGKVRIIQTTVDKPILASKNYFSRYGMGPTGRMHVEGFTLVGNKDNRNNHGLLVRDYYSKVIEIETIDTGGDGIRFHHKNDINQDVGHSLVENIIKNCEVRNSTGYCYRIGDEDNNRFTDGFFIDCLAVSSDNTPAHVLIGTASGWKIDGIHTYGPAPSSSVLLINTFHTKIINVYIESFKNIGLAAHKIQYGVQINAVSIRCMDAVEDGQAISLSRSQAVSGVEASVAISNVYISQNNNIKIYGVYSYHGDFDVNVSTISFAGLKKDRIIKYQSFDLLQFKRIEDAVITEQLRETPNKVTLKYNGIGLAQYGQKNVSGNGNQAISIPVSKMKSYQKISGTLSILANKYDAGGKQAEFIAQVMISAKDNLRDQWSVIVSQMVAPTGFKEAPQISASHTGNDQGNLNINFAFEQEGATGVASFLYTPSEM